MSKELQQEPEQEPEAEQKPVPPSSEEVGGNVVHPLKEAKHVCGQTNKPLFTAGQLNHLRQHEYLLESRRAERRKNLEQV